ncbi:MAG: hypothetical protein OHK0017_05000 [Patescibacteria group bacterium]
MTDYKEIITQLLSNSTTNHADEYFLSLYMPFALPEQALNLNEFGTRLKSQLLSDLGQDSELADAKDLRQEIAFKISDLAKNINVNMAGVAVFLRFNLSKEQDRLLEFDQSNLTIVPLHQAPSLQTYIGKTYDLAQLSSISCNNLEALVFNLDRNKCELFHFDPPQFNVLETVSNPFFENLEPKSHSRRYVTPGQGDYNVSAGEDHNWDIEEDKHFLQLIYEKLKEFDGKIPILIGFYSSIFDEFLNNTDNNLLNSNLKFETNFVGKNIQEQQQVESEAIDKYNKILKQRHRLKLETAQEANDLFKIGLDDVLGAVRLSQVDQLFIIQNLMLPGYILQQSLPYLDEQPDSIAVKNIYPWIVKQVLQTGGEVCIVQTGELNNEIAAKTRY